MKEKKKRTKHVLSIPEGAEETFSVLRDIVQRENIGGWLDSIVFEVVFVNPGDYEFSDSV